MKEYQILLEHILQDAESKNLHRDQKTGTIFKPKHGISYHFEPYMEPKEYINDLFLDDKMFQSNIGNMSKLVRYLTNIDSSRFPFLKRDRNYIGFKNGILDIKSCHFKSTNEEAIKVQNYIDTEINIDSLDTPIFDQLLLDQFPTTFERFKGVSQFIMMKKSGKKSVKRWESDPTSRAIFWLSSREHSKRDKLRFCKIFGPHGFIPGYNLKSL